MKSRVDFGTFAKFRGLGRCKVRIITVIRAILFSLFIVSRQFPNEYRAFGSRNNGGKLAFSKRTNNNCAALNEMAAIGEFCLI